MDVIRLYMFEGLPVYTDATREDELLRTDVYVKLRIARQRWSATHEGRAPRYLVWFDGHALGSDKVATCVYCMHDRACVGSIILCKCEGFVS